MTRKPVVLAVIALGALVSQGTPAAHASDDPPSSQRLVWKTTHGDGFAEALGFSAVADRTGDSVVMARDLILTPAKGRLVLTETTYMRRDLTRIRLLDEKTGWWVQLEAATGLDLGSFEHMDRQSVEELKEQLARERHADPWHTYALTGTGGLQFSTRAKSHDSDDSRKLALALAEAIAQSHALDGSSASPVGEELLFLHDLWRRFDEPPPVPEVVLFIAALNAALPRTPALEQAAKTYTDGSWKEVKSDLATGTASGPGGPDKAAADAFLRQFKSVSPTNPLLDAAN
ncbi:MAG TPA: hypothetical protein VOA87_06225 [Thermoanaerobaculia bacterium]|nr:hypothetical protein [Thermoanaerobaculia bacterium]